MTLKAVDPAKFLRRVIVVFARESYWLLFWGGFLTFGGTVFLGNEPKPYDDSEEKLFFCIMNHGDGVLKKITILFPDGSLFSSHIVLAKGDAQNALKKGYRALYYRNQWRTRIFLFPKITTLIDAT